MKNTKILLGNAFSLQMLQLNAATNLQVTPVSKEEIAISDFLSCVGHPDTAAVLSDTLGKTVECNRISVALEKGDVLYVAQLVGGRLPEGSTTLPEGFAFKFVKVEIL